MSAAPVTVSSPDLRAFAEGIFRQAGFSDSDAETIADVLIWANLRGVDSHGVMRIPRYINLVDQGRINPAARMDLQRPTPVSAVLEADNASGPVAMHEAMRTAIDKARDSTVGWVQVAHTSHCGAIGYFTLMAAEADMIGIAIAASRPNMAYYGARVPGVSTSPIAIAVPGGEHPPLMLDMATAVISMGKLMNARNAGRALEPGQAIDAEGRMTTDSAEAVVPMSLGGPKGSGLSLMFECLTSLMVGVPLLAPAILDNEREHMQNALVIAVDIAAFTDPASYKSEIDRLVSALKALPPAEGVDEVMAPGERGDAKLPRREANGIPVPAGIWNNLAGLSERFGVTLPETN